MRTATMLGCEPRTMLAACASICGSRGTGRWLICSARLMACNSARARCSCPTVSATLGLTSARTDAMTAIVIAEASTVVFVWSFRERIRRARMKDEGGRMKKKQSLHQRDFPPSSFILHPCFRSWRKSRRAAKPPQPETLPFRGKLELHQRFDGSRFAYSDACEL